MTPEEESLTPAAQKRILIVDDDESTIEFLEMVIKKDGFKTETAGDGQEALDKVQQAPPDLILLDLKLPKRQGLEILKLLQQGDSPDIPVIVITGHQANRQTQELIKQEPNVKGYFAKPVNAAVLTMHIHSVLKTRPALSQQPLDW